MGLNRMMMKNGVELKGINAMMTVGMGIIDFGFKNESYGSLSPNPLPNGVLVTACYSLAGNFVLVPPSIKSCTINNITVNSGTDSMALFSYLRENKNKTIPVIFHFD